MKSFLSGKPSLNAAPLASASPKLSLSPAPKPAAAHRAHAHAAGPQIDLVKEGGKVTRIVVTCTCGERIEVECLYPAGS